MIRSRFVDLAGKQIDLTLSAQLLERVLGLKLSARPAATGSFMSSLSEFDNIRNFLTSATILTLVDLPFVLLFLALITWIAPVLVIIPLVSMLLACLIAVFVNKPLQKRIFESQQVASERQSFIMEALIGLETIKTSSAESQNQYRWERLNRYMAETGLQIRRLQFISSQSATFIMQVSTVLIVAGGVYLIGLGELSMGGLIATMMISGRCTAPVVQSIALLNQFQKTKQAMEHTDAIMNLPQERPVNRRFLKLDDVKGAITIGNLSFSYPEAQPLLKDVSLNIAAGEKVAILGRMGSGKSTLLQLLMGLWEPLEGSISLDGFDLRQLDPSTLRKGIGYVPQRINLFTGTVRENIALGRYGISDESLIRAVKQAGLGELFVNSEAGLDIQVGESGRNLSGGQIQSIGIARALLDNPPILILDEPTSSMDSQCEAVFKNTLKAMAEKTIILVTHKMTMLDAMEKVVVIEQGKIAAVRAARDIISSQRKQSSTAYERSH